MVDIEARRKNWNSRIGDTFLWLGNKYLYEKYQITTRELNTLGMLNETYGETRENTYLDSNTIRLPEENILYNYRFWYRCFIYNVCIK